MKEVKKKNMFGDIIVSKKEIDEYFLYFDSKILCDEFIGKIVYGEKYKKRIRDCFDSNTKYLNVTALVTDNLCVDTPLVNKIVKLYEKYILTHDYYYFINATDCMHNVNTSFYDIMGVKHPGVEFENITSVREVIKKYAFKYFANDGKYDGESYSIYVRDYENDIELERFNPFCGVRESEHIAIDVCINGIS